MFNVQPSCRVISAMSTSCSEPTRKRARDGEATLEPHTAFWFTDGNVVLVAQTTAFKVHRGVLSRHSPIFTELFIQSDPMDAELIDGAPVITLEDDPHEVSDLLDVMYHGTR